MLGSSQLDRFRVTEADEQMVRGKEIPQPVKDLLDAYRSVCTTVGRRVRVTLPGDRVLITRDGDRLVIEPVRKPSLLEVLASLKPLQPEDQFPDVEDALPPLKDIDL